MRKWIPIALIAVAIAWFILTNVGSSMALADFAARPILALSRDGTRIDVEQPGKTEDAPQARFAGAEGIQFGHRFRFALPDGSLVICTHRFRSLACDGGWQPVRAPALAD